ncbi:MAG: GGDEF domain-containing protein [Coriobacteriia bacterium]|nr:GGDEF domain-containing protein [Coriobacteriia bacterium]
MSALHVSGSHDRESSAPTSSPGGMSSFRHRLASAPLLARVGSSFLLLGFVALLDYLTGEELSFSVFYLLPVLLAGTFISRDAGRAAALAGAVVWGYLEVEARVYSAAWVVVWNTTVRLIFFLAINELVRVARRAHERERALSRTDSLTGIANRRVFTEHIEREIAKSGRDGRSFTIVYLDLDHFKRVNDFHGHSEGDGLLRAVAETISSELRTVDLVARIGGDEFGLVLTATSAEGAQMLLARVAEALRRETGERWGVSATFGAVTFVEPPATADSAVKLADELMYRGKSQDRDTIVQMIWPSDYVEAE